jgi:hypothetical protein
MKNELTANLKQFVLGGKATFTIFNAKSNKRFTYRVKASKDRKVFFVSGKNEKRYVYMGCIFNKKNYTTTKKSKVNTDDLINKSFVWFWHMISNNKSFPSGFHFYHEGKCGQCGRNLTTPESIERGFGPECWKMIKKFKF